MVEGGADQVPEADVLGALRFGFEAIQPILDGQEELVRRAGKPKLEVKPAATDAALRSRVEELAKSRIEEASRIVEKKQRYAAFDEIKAEVLDTLLSEYRGKPLAVGTYAELEAAHAGFRAIGAQARDILSKLRSEVIRERILSGGSRIDGRATADIRPIACEVNVFERLHGSAVFQRGETQALATVTLGGSGDEQLIDDLRPKHTRRFLMHYNFPPFSVGEVRRLVGTNRREQGHGALAQRAILPVIPEPDDCPYTIRIVSEIFESNGSSSMATVCGTTLALMQAGIPITAPVAGIAMGLISDGKRYKVLSDILGDEDHLGDMDFKVTGSPDGITAIQMDLKIEGLDWDILETALAQAREGRLHILERMAEETAEQLPGFAPRPELAPSAPRVEVVWVKPDRIRDLIGPGGKVIRAIQASTGAKIDVDDSGRVLILSPDHDRLERCRAMIEELTQDAEIDRVYRGKVKKVTDFGAFVEIFPGTDGLLHISELADRRVDKVEDICVEGDDVLVKCIDIDPSGKIRLSRRAALADAEEAQATH
jgi:polyribonucleotide nucleotidyltransferase